ncbi:MAG: hypothetical protein KIT60_06945 [Burkholderiaceae bacterium]|nr:hypothetical protein [Burkholderiaceae bacterium]
MTVKLLDTQTTTTAGVKAPATLAKWPEGGATASVGLSAGTATVELLAWVSAGYKQKLATFSLDVTGGEASEALPIASIWDDWEWNVLAIAGGGTLTLALVGLGL